MFLFWLIPLIILLVILIVSLLLAILINIKLKVMKVPQLTDLYRQEEEQFAELGISLNKIANIVDADQFEIPTKLKKIQALRWSHHHQKVVVFVHGVLCDKYTACKVVDLWRKRGYDVVSFDGYGWGSNRDYGWTTKFSVKNTILLNDVINFVCEKYNIKQILLHGESMGGGTVYRFLEKYSHQKIEKVLVDAGYLSFIKSLKYAVFNDVNKPVYYWASLTLWLVMLSCRYPVFRNIKKATLKKIAFPLLHLHSKDDIKVYFSYFETEKKHFGNHAYYRIYQNPVRHVRGYYDAPKELDQFIAEFVKKK